MSLINDALKQASRSRQASASEAAATLPLRPVDHDRPPSQAMLLALPFLLALVLMLAGWFFWKGWQQAPGAIPSTAPIATVPAPARSLPAATAQSAPKARDEQRMETRSDAAVTAPPVPQTASSRMEQPVPVQLEAPNPVSSVAVEAPTVKAGTLEAAPAANAVRTLKLQGVYYRPSNPSALINGQSVFVGDTVDEARIVKIERQSVTVEFSGQTKVLSLRN